MTEWISLGTPSTRAEVRAFRISLADEAIPQLRREYACPGCGALHEGPIAILLPLIEEGYAALRETSLESVRTVRRLRGEAAGDRRVRDLEKIVEELTGIVNEQRKEIERLRKSL